MLQFNGHNFSLIYQFRVAFQLNWDEYINTYIMGTRLYLLKEKPETLPQARILLNRLYILDKLVSALFYSLVLWFAYSYWSAIIHSFEYALDYSSNVFTQRMKSF